MKKYLTLTSLLVAGTLCANAEGPQTQTNPTPGTAVFNFGRQDNETWMASESSWNKVIFSTDGDAGGGKKTDNTTQISLQMTTGTMAGTGPGGSFSVTSSDSNPPAIHDNLKALSTAVLGGNTYDNLWGGSANAWDPNTATFTISGLQHGWDYEIYLLSARANTKSGATGTTWTIAGTGSETNISGVQVSTTSLGASPSSTASSLSVSWTEGSTSGTVNFDGDHNGKNATIVGFKFNAGMLDAITLSSKNSSNFTVNGIVVRAIPEPSMFGLLAGMGALALVSSRRRRK